MKINVQNRQRRYPINQRAIRGAARKVLTSEGCQQAELGIAFVTAPQIRKLNSRFRKKDTPTDVLAFDYLNTSGKRPSKKMVSGDIAISVDAAIRAAKQNNSSVNEEILLYLIHGILHLLGYNHSQKHDSLKMRRREKELLKSLNLTKHV